MVEAYSLYDLPPPSQACPDRLFQTALPKATGYGKLTVNH
jgi:hypothetical protein